MVDELIAKAGPAQTTFWLGPKLWSNESSFLVSIAVVVSGRIQPSNLVQHCKQMLSAALMIVRGAGNH